MLDGCFALSKLPVHRFTERRSRNRARAARDRAAQPQPTHRARAARNRAAQPQPSARSAQPAHRARAARNRAALLHTALASCWQWSRLLGMKDWSECGEVERLAGKVSGAWLFRGTRVPVKALFENLEDGATVDDFLDWFPGVARHQVEAVLDFAAASLELSPVA